MQSKQNEQCSICERPITRYGNNAHPFPGRCCDDCDNIAVTPARICMFRLANKAKTHAREQQNG